MVQTMSRYSSTSYVHTRLKIHSALQMAPQEPSVSLRSPSPQNPVAAVGCSATTAPLRLQHFTLRSLPGSSSSAVLVLLAALPSSSLTSLQCSVPSVTAENVEDEVQDEPAPPRLAGSQCSAYPRLQQLRELDISYVPWLCDVLGEYILAPLQSLLHLTKLLLGMVQPQQLWHLPHSLQQLYVGVEVTELESLAGLGSWLELHAAMLARLRLLTRHVGLEDAEFAANTKVLAAALQTAAAAAPGGQLQLLHWESDSQMHADVYKQLASCCKLQELQCGLHQDSIAESMVVVSGMSSLRSLQLFTGYETDLCSMSALFLQPLSGLMGLTKFVSYDVRPVQLNYLPAQLVELEVDVDTPHAGDPAMNLSHLVALTRLQLKEYNLCTGDVLAHNIVTASVDGMPYAEPLLRLHGLQELFIDNGNLTAGTELERLSSLSSLASLHLTYQGTDRQCLRNGSDNWDDASVAAWAVLPLVDLDILVRSSDVVGIPACVVKQLGRLQGLTRLSLRTEPDGGVLHATVKQLTAALHELTALEVLSLEVAVPHDAGNSHDVEALELVVDALPSLKSSKVDVQPWVG